MRRILMLTMVASLAFASAGLHKHPANKGYQDRDMDGVLDKDDRCPHTPFFALVNKNGCMIKRLKVGKAQERSVKKLLTKLR